MIWLLLWALSGVIGMLMTTWATAQEAHPTISDPRSVEARTFTIGHLLLGVVIGPISLIIGIISIVNLKKWVKYVDAFLSAKLFEWRDKICANGGHEWERLDDTPASGDWCYENRRCKRCGVIDRVLVASREG